MLEIPNRRCDKALLVTGVVDRAPIEGRSKREALETKNRATRDKIKATDRVVGTLRRSA